MDARASACRSAAAAARTGVLVGARGDPRLIELEAGAEHLGVVDAVGARQPLQAGRRRLKVLQPAAQRALGVREREAAADGDALEVDRRQEVREQRAWTRSARCVQAISAGRCAVHWMHGELCPRRVGGAPARVPCSPSAFHRQILSEHESTHPSPDETGAVPDATHTFERLACCAAAAAAAVASAASAAAASESAASSERIEVAERTWIRVIG